MRICMIMSSPLPPREGIGFYVWNLSRYLTARGHQVQIITRGKARRTIREEIEGITIWRPPFVPAYPFHVHLHGIFVDRLVRRLESEIDLFHVHSPLVKWPRTHKPVLATVHTPMKADTGAIQPTNLWNTLIKLQAPVSYRLEQNLFDRANKITAVAQSVADELKEYAVDRQQVCVLGNGVDTTTFFPSTSNNNSHDPYIFTAGRLAPRKGLEDLIRSAEYVVRELPNVRFLIAGTGPLEAELRTIIAQRKLEDRVILLGHIEDRARMLELYQGAAAYVHAAHYEGLPTVLLEAMSCGRPTIATAVSGALDVIEDGCNGILVPPRDPRGIATAVISVLRNPDLGKRLGAAARRTIEERFSWSTIGQAYLTQYSSLLQGAGE